MSIRAGEYAVGRKIGLERVNITLSRLLLALTSILFADLQKTVKRLNACLQTAGGHFQHLL
jgi:hypothetical protein